jgi:hypothetical protein
MPVTADTVGDMLNDAQEEAQEEAQARRRWRTGLPKALAKFHSLAMHPDRKS